MDKDDAMEHLEISTECLSLDPYSCEDAIKRLNDYLDKELSPEERTVVLKHLEICRSCLGRFSFEQSLIISIRSKISRLCAPDGLREKLHNMLRNG